MAGASAGGLNGVLFGSAIRNGFRMVALLPIWQEVAAVERLRREKGPWISLFDGDEKFLDVIHEKLAEVIEGQEGQEEAQESYVDLQLSATLVQPIDQAAPGPSDEPLRRSRPGARFHFRHDPAAGPPRRGLGPGRRRPSRPRRSRDGELPVRLRGGGGPLGSSGRVPAARTRSAGTGPPGGG